MTGPSSDLGPGVPVLVPDADLVAEPHQGVVGAVDHAFLHRDDRVVGDVDALGADLRAALGDVAVAQAGLLAGDSASVHRVERVHVELGVAQEEAGTGEVHLVVLVVAHDVTGVLAQEALDALAELLAALDVLLHHPALAVGVPGRELGVRQLLRLLVVVGDVGDQAANDGKGPHGGDGDRLGLVVVREPAHAHQLRAPVDLGAARAALAGLAVPADREGSGPGGLHAMDRVEHHLTGLDLDVVVLELTAGLVAAPQSHLQRVCHGVSALPRRRRPARPASPAGAGWSGRHRRRWS